MAQGNDPLTPVHEAGVLLRYLSQLGHVLLSTGDTVSVVEDTVHRTAVAYGAQRVSVVALPTALFIKFEYGGELHLDFTGQKNMELRFDQIEEVFGLAARAREGTVTPMDGLAKLEAILAQPPAFAPWWRLLGHVLVTVGIALVLQPTVGVVASAAIFGLVVGALKLVSQGRGVFTLLLPTVAAFLVAAISLEAARWGFGASPLRVLIASLVTFIPGGMLAIATMELAYGDTVSGGTRFVAGLLRLVFLILGMGIAASLVGLPPEKLLAGADREKLGAWAPWLGVLLFAVGHTLHYSARPWTLPWLLVVLFVTYTMQAIGTAAFGAYMGGFVGALFVTPFVYFIQYRLGGPAAVVLFQPALWLLVPGALGVAGMAELVTDNRLAGLEDVATAVFTIIAVAFGSMIGAGVYDALVEPIFRRTGSLVTSMWGTTR